tara:strand:- start:16276 stop:17559 length:1284 start_codon:yes stop_codon:yes gene_type:complete
MTHNTDITPTKVQQDSKLGVIPDGWTTPKISEVFQFINTTSFSRNQLNYDEENEVFYIHYGDIHATYKKPILDFEIETEVPRLNDDIELPNSIQYLKDGDVIIADASEDYEGVGEAIEMKNLNGKKVISGLHTFALRDLKNKTVPGFRTYVFKNQNVKKALKTIATGSKVYGISKGNIQKFKIVLPPLPEQQKIAKILATWDVAINKQEALIAQKQEQKKVLMQQLLTGKKRLPGFTDEWGQVKMQKIVSIASGESPSKHKFVDDGQYPYLKVEDLNNCSKYQLASRNYSNKSTNLVSKGSIIFPKRGAAILNNKIRIASCEVHMDSNLMAVTPICEKVSTEFLFYKIFREKLSRIADTSTIPQINNKHINPYKISLPSLKEQQKIAEVLTAADNEITALQQQLQQLKTQKQGLMQQLLTGKIRVKN